MTNLLERRVHTTYSKVISESRLIETWALFETEKKYLWQFDWVTIHATYFDLFETLVAPNVAKSCSIGERCSSGLCLCLKFVQHLSMSRDCPSYDRWQGFQIKYEKLRVPKFVQHLSCIQNQKRINFQRGEWSKFGLRLDFERPKVGCEVKTRSRLGR